MATWGKIEIKTSEYYPNTLYYNYSTTTDSYYFQYKGEDDYGVGKESFNVEIRMGNEQGEAIMEALIHHLLAFDFNGEAERFVERYITNNRFKKGQRSDR